MNGGGSGTSSTEGKVATHEGPDWRPERGSEWEQVKNFLKEN
jgi:hypothetical protein